MDRATEIDETTHWFIDRPTEHNQKSTVLQAKRPKDIEEPLVL